MPLTDALYTLPFDPPVANALRSEFESMPWQRRIRARRKAVFRALALHLGGQGRWLRDRVPADSRRVLVVYSWTTVGDALMDLAARSLVPAHVQLDLCIAPHLAPLFAADDVFAGVHTDLETYDGEPDFILLDCLTSALLRQKARRFPDQPFASLRGQLIGEQFDRTAVGDRRMRQLFGLPPGPVVRPRMGVTRPRAGARSPRFRLAVGIGARCDDRRYPYWPQVLTSLAAHWPQAWPAPEFWLLGSDNALGELAAFDPPFLRDCCVVKVGCGCLQETAAWLRDCDAYLGVDGGLMHMAMALDVPGLALLADVHPDYRIRPGCGMRAMLSPCRLDDLGPTQIAGRFIQVVADLAPAAVVDPLHAAAAVSLAATRAL